MTKDGEIRPQTKSMNALPTALRTILPRLVEIFSCRSLPRDEEEILTWKGTADNRVSRVERRTRPNQPTDRRPPKFIMDVVSRCGGARGRLDHVTIVSASDYPSYIAFEIQRAWIEPGLSRTLRQQPHEDIRRAPMPAAATAGPHH